MRPCLNRPNPPPCSSRRRSVSVAAVLFAGLGGLSEAPWRILCGMGVLFCLIMLVVFGMMAANEQSMAMRRGLAWAYGALVGLCHGLFFAPDGGVLSLLLHMGGAALVARAAFWRLELTSPSMWDRD